MLYEVITTQTRFMAGPSGVLILTVQPAQPPTAQAMIDKANALGMSIAAFSIDQMQKQDC